MAVKLQQQLRTRLALWTVIELVNGDFRWAVVEKSDVNTDGRLYTMRSLKTGHEHKISMWELHEALEQNIVRAMPITQAEMMKLMGEAEVV